MTGPFVRRVQVCRDPLLLAVAVCSITLSARGQSTPAPRRGGNPEAAKVKNPVPYAPESVAAGKRTYARLCVSWHGPSGKGDGGGAGGGGRPADLTGSSWEYGSSDGEIFSVIHNGTSADMQGYADQLSDKDIWNVVNFIRSIGPGKKQP